MYFADSFQRCIWAYDYDLDAGSIANRRIFATVPEGEGFPDGLTVDAEDHVWNAQIDGWCIKRYDPSGAIDRVISLPVRRPTSVGFGGSSYETLFVTTGSARLTEEELATQPLAGCVLKLSPGVRGRPEPTFMTNGDVPK
jgi:sugar lactone lactonase YvrE